MKHLILPTLFTLNFQLLTLSAAVPLRWTVETSRLAPAVFDVVRGETIALEAAFNSAGKPFSMDGEPVSIFWQTNGMGNAWWTAPAVVTNRTIEQSEQSNNPNNLVRATFTPEMDPGAATVNGFLGSSGSIYRAAFTFRFRHGPGAVPNTLPLPVPVIDFAKVRVLNPPWSGGGGGGVDTNAVRDIIDEYLSTNGIRSVDGEGRYLPPYLHYKEMDDTYPDAAAEWYAQADYSHGSCSARRSGNLLERNYDWNFNFMPEYVIGIPAGPGRFASLAVCNVGTNLTEADVTSGKHLRWLKALPGHAVDGVNENGMVCEVNVMDGTPPASTGGDIHPLAAVRWALDNGTSAGMVASNLAARIKFPVGWTQNFHWMIADERETWIVENGAASNVTAVAAKRVMTNFAILPDTYEGEGAERYAILTNAANSITNAWFTRAYRRETNPPWFSEFGGNYEYLNAALNAWDNGKGKESHRGETYAQTTYPFKTYSWWQTVHTSVYDITNRTLRVAVQEVDDWYVFAVPSAGGVTPADVREIIGPLSSAITTNADGTVAGGKIDLGYGGELKVGTEVDGGFEVKTGVNDPTVNFENIRITFGDGSSFLDHPTIEGPKIYPWRGIGDWWEFGVLAFHPWIMFHGEEGIGGTYEYHFPEKSATLAALDDIPDVSGKRDITDNTCHVTERSEWVLSNGTLPDEYTTITGPFIIEESGKWAVVTVWHGISSGPFVDGSSSIDSATATFVCSTAAPSEQFTLVYERQYFCTTGELFVTQSYVTNAVNAAKYVPTATDPTFSNAVLAVQIDTNTVAQIGELKQFFDDLPVGTVGTSVGGILLALLSAVAWLKKKTAEIETNVGTANAVLAAALDGTEVA